MNLVDFFFDSPRRFWWLLFGALLVLFLLFGCKGKGSTGPGPLPTPDPGKRAPSPIGYSHVTNFTGAHAQEVADAGLTFAQVEPFHDPDIPLSEVRKAKEAMVRVGGRLLITVVNVNESIATTWSDADFDNAVRRIIDEVGTESVWLEAVSNGQENHRGWQDRARAIWPGEVIFALHPCTLDAARALLAPGRWVVSDCTPILASNVTKQDIQDLTRLAIERKAIWLWYDTFPSVPWSSQIIQWMKEVL